MEEKAMVIDALNSINASLKSYGDMISQTENQQLRQKLQQLRNDCETSQYELFCIAKDRNYYQPARVAQEQDIQQVKNFFSNSGN